MDKKISKIVFKEIIQQTKNLIMYKIIKFASKKIILNSWLLVSIHEKFSHDFDWISEG